MDSTVDEQNAIDVYHKLSQLWEKAGMHARKWLSNSTQVLKEVRQDRLTNCRECLDRTNFNLCQVSLKRVGVEIRLFKRF